MTATPIGNTIRAAALCALASVSIAASPALANSASAAVEMPVPAKDVRADAAVGGDVQFRQLFAQWKSLDQVESGTTVIGTSPAVQISIPSRMPLEGAALTSDYGMRTHPVLGGRRAHSGVDLAAPTGTPIYATADGIVSRADRFSSYGLYVSIEHGANLQTRFAHMSRIAVAQGDRIRKGDVIGYVGSTGRSTGPHLHYEVRIGGEAVNPIPYMVETQAQQAFAMTRGEGGRGGD